ncbi:MAG: sarcosine oxidase subunit beta [Rhodospirillaceae bacterium]|nr:sarcosine oxidase subunit beta [Rhodospirillaceae bacterium]|tara:strand:- start:23288 stop:24544 length:1257 start_codon:yes stop_codon:yes gene_type:complete
MPFGLLKFGLNKGHPVPRALPGARDLKDSYDIVIVGGGGHGLATAYYLAVDHGITNVAVLDKGYIGGGNTGRNTTIIRSNYLTPEGVKFYDESVNLYKDLANDFDMNLMYSERGHYTLAHTDSAVRTMRWRAEVNKHFGIQSELVLRDDLMKLVPELNYSEDVRYPIMGALYHQPGAIARHDAVAWGYGAGAAKRGVHIHQKTEVTGFEITKANGSPRKVAGVKTTRGTIKAGKVIQCVAGMSGVVSDMAGFKLPLKTIPLQACVSQPLKPFLDAIVVSGSLHVYVSQSSRGELVMGGSTDPYGVYQTRSTLDFKEGLMMHMMELLPYIGEVKLLRQWAGMTDMTPDFAPIMGETPVDNYYIDAGWGTWGFKATPVCGKRNAEMLATGKVPETIAPFALQRYHDFKLVGEKGAASVGH